MEQLYKQLRTTIALLLCCLLPALSFGQVKIGGTVTDDTHQPLPGVTIQLNGTTKGTVTDENGRFLFTAEKGQILTFKFIGYQTQEVTVTDHTAYDITLKSDSKALNEVVVTALGVKKETRRVGYATQTVNGDDLTTARDPNPIAGLQGKVAGLSVGPSAELLACLPY